MPPPQPPSFADYLERLRARVTEWPPQEVARRLAGPAPPLLVDCREPDEVAALAFPGALHVPRARLESTLDAVAPDRAAPLVIACREGVRSVLVAAALQDMGYTRVASMAGGAEAWRAAGLPVRTPAPPPEACGVAPAAPAPAPAPSPDGSDELARYLRQMRLPELGAEGQRVLQRARVTIVGVGGLGAPAALYLAAAGVGTLRLVDDDQVALSNLHRQVLYGQGDVGQPKVLAAAAALGRQNAQVRVEPHRARLTPANARTLLEGADVIVDATDNFEARYLINDTAVALGVPHVHGSIARFDGQCAVFGPARAGGLQSASGAGPCYRCLFPAPPPAALAPRCVETGVLGASCGVIGSLQAVEALKLLLEAGEPLRGRLLTYDGLGGRFRELRFGRDPSCPVCGGGSPPSTAPTSGT